MMADVVVAQELTIPTTTLPRYPIIATREQLETLRRLLEANSHAEFIERRKTFNMNLQAHLLMNAGLFSPTSAAGLKKKTELSLCRKLNELYLTGNLTLESDEVKQFLSLDDGMTAERMVKMLPKSVMDIVMPGATGANGTLSNSFATNRSKKGGFGTCVCGC